MYLNSLKKLITLTKSIHTISIRCMTSVQGNLFVNILGMSPENAYQYVQKHKLESVDTIRLAEALKFFSTRKFKVDTILRYPRIFKSCEVFTWEQYYLYLTEFGYMDIAINDLLYCRHIRGMTVKDLKSRDCLPKDQIFAETLIKHLSPPPPHNIIDDLKDDDLTASYIHTTIVRRYLMYRFDVSNDDIDKLSRVYRSIYNKSLQNLSENINLAFELGYSKQKLLRNGYILSSRPQLTKEVLKTIPNFAGTCMRTQMKMYPKLIGISVHNILRIYDILKEENISDEMIKRAMNIFTLSPKTVKSRLNDIKQTDDTRVIMNNPRVLTLVIHFNRAKSRLQFMKQVELRCTSLIVLGDGQNEFDNHIKEGKDINKIPEVDRFVKERLKLEDGSEIQFRRHPYYLYVPLVDIEDTYLYLKGKMFSNSNISSAMHILLYPKDKVGDALEKIKSDTMLNSRKLRLKNSQKLNIALYFLEKEHHFTGNGIWRKNDTDKS